MSKLTETRFQSASGVGTHDLRATEDLRGLAGLRSPWVISVYMPTRRHGCESFQNPARLRQLLKQAENELHLQGLWNPEVQEALNPVYEASLSPSFWHEEAESMAIFVSRDHLFRIPFGEYVGERVVVSQDPFITPLVVLPLDRQAQAAVQLFREPSQADRVTSNERDIVEAAHCGGIESLLVSDSAEMWGRYNAVTHRIKFHDTPIDRDIELINRSALQTLWHGGQVYRCEHAQMPGHAPMMAIFREG